MLNRLPVNAQDMTKYKQKLLFFLIYLSNNLKQSYQNSFSLRISVIAKTLYCCIFLLDKNVRNRPVFQTVCHSRGSHRNSDIHLKLK